MTIGITVFVLLLIVVIIYLIYLIITKNKNFISLQEMLSQLQNVDGENTELKNKIEVLSKFEQIIDAESQAQNIIEIANLEAKSIIDEANQKNIDATNKAERIIDLANIEANSITQEAKIVLSEAKNKATEIKKDAELSAESIKTQAQNLLYKVNSEYNQIISNAKDEANRISDGALAAMEKAKELENTIKALKNIIEGYGDSYIIPTFGLLDELAQDFAHKQAGEKLAMAREHSKMMVVNGTAAKCDYVEETRKRFAIQFVLDAFNGKVESILNKVKKDNYGILKQKIVDAYQVVNYNGSAFRNAAITKLYLDAKIEELRWAVVTQELKIQEQEEQRRIKEQIREEEKARKEYEKAIKEAQKEEELLTQLIEKARKQVENATEEQKQKYEEKLDELQQKLKLAEEKNQRALSMAQQTRSGNVYIISNVGSFGEDVYKIGMTRRLEPMDRVKELGDASVPFEFDVHAMIYSQDAPSLEKNLHKKFLHLQMNKVNPRKEFFKLELSEIIDEVSKMNLEVNWTMVAEAKQYRESMAIEQAIRNNEEQKQLWIKNQLEQEDSITELSE